MVFLSKFIEISKNIFDNFTLVIIILVGLSTLLIDGSRLKNKGFTKELTIVKIISYSYIVLGIIMFVLLRVV